MYGADVTLALSLPQKRYGWGVNMAPTLKRVHISENCIRVSIFIEDQIFFYYGRRKWIKITRSLLTTIRWSNLCFRSVFTLLSASTSVRFTISSLSTLLHKPIYLTGLSAFSLAFIFLLVHVYFRSVVRLLFTFFLLPFFSLFQTTRKIQHYLTILNEYLKWIISNVQRIGGIKWVNVTNLPSSGQFKLFSPINIVKCKNVLYTSSNQEEIQRWIGK